MEKSSSAEKRLRCWHPRGLLCAVCRRPTAGFGWSGPQRTKHSGPSVWFCSISCQRFFWLRARTVPDMVDLTEQEMAAIRATLQPIAAMLDALGWQTPPSAWSQEQMLQLISVAIESFQAAMHQAAMDDPMEVPF